MEVIVLGLSCLSKWWCVATFSSCRESTTGIRLIFLAIKLTLVLSIAPKAKKVWGFFSPIEARKIPKWIIFSQSSKLNRHKSTYIKKSNTYSKFKFDVMFLVLVFFIFSLWFHMTLKELFIPIRKQRFFPNWTGMGSLLKKVKKITYVAVCYWVCFLEIVLSLWYNLTTIWMLKDPCSLSLLSGVNFYQTLYQGLACLVRVCSLVFQFSGLIPISRFFIFHSDSSWSSFQPLAIVGQLSVTGERMSTALVYHFD